MKLIKFLNKKLFPRYITDTASDQERIAIFKQQYDAQMVRDKIKTGAFIN